LNKKGDQGKTLPVKIVTVKIVLTFGIFPGTLLNLRLGRDIFQKIIKKGG